MGFLFRLLVCEDLIVGVSINLGSIILTDFLIEAFFSAGGLFCGSGCYYSAAGPDFLDPLEPCDRRAYLEPADFLEVADFRDTLSISGGGTIYRLVDAFDMFDLLDFFDLLDKISASLALPLAVSPPSYPLEWCPYLQFDISIS